ncbi:MAG: hypothetical protein LBP63_00240, partial [Prevotellaceae bacterium]|nr:hypothetical protein [Prevotellaceae bacterium]
RYLPPYSLDLTLLSESGGICEKVSHTIDIFQLCMNELENSGGCFPKCLNQIKLLKLFVQLICRDYIIV